MDRNYNYENFLSQIVRTVLFGRDVSLTDQQAEELSGIIKKSSKTQRDEIVLRNYYSLDCERVTEKKIAEKLGVSTSRVQQLRCRMEEAIRDILVSQRKYVIQSSSQKKVLESMEEEIKILKEKIVELQGGGVPILLSKIRNEISPKLGWLLERLRVRTLNELTGVTKLELLSHKNIGECTVSEIESLLKKYGLCLADCYREDRIEKSLMFFGKIGELLRQVPVESLDLSVRTSNCLKEAGIKNLGQLVNKGSEELFEIRNFGKPCLKEVKKKLAFYGLALAS